MQPPPSANDAEVRTPPSLRARALHWPRAFAGWAGDLGRLYWGLSALNFRKSLFRWGRMRCPCQHPSDSGRAYETACDARVAWSSPVRFHRLCPLLRQAPDGEWKCSVNTADVRPFWGRALGIYGGTALAIYLAAAFVAFGFFRVVGYPVSYRAVVWPPAWHEIGQARARYFYVKAQRAMQANNPMAAMMALSQSYQLDPGNYMVGRLLAQFSQPGWADMSNHVYEQLMREHPERAQETAQAWFTALLARGDFTEIEDLASQRIATDPAWVNALLFASRRTGDRVILLKLLQTPHALPRYAAQVFTLEIELRANPTIARGILRQPMPASPAPYLVYYWIGRQIHLGMGDDALILLNRYGGLLTPRDRIELLLGAFTVEGWPAILDGEVDQLLNSGPNAPLVELLSAYLIRHPNPHILDKLFDAVYRRPLPPNGDLLGAYTSLFCAAGAEGDWLRMQAAAAELKSITRSQFTALDVAEAYFRGAVPPVRLTRCLRSLPGLPLEVMYAMYDREHPQ